MAQPMTAPAYWEEEQREIEEELLREVEDLVMEDDTPVDNIFCEKEQRLLTDTLYASWPGALDEAGNHRKFLALANVGLFPAIHQKVLVPDVLLSLDVVARNQQEKRNRSYLLWEFGKLPEVVIEIISNRKGGELDEKMQNYARLNIPYYIVHDHLHLFGEESLLVFEWTQGRYVRKEDNFLPLVGLGVTVWEGEYQDLPARWLRWCDQEGNLLLTGNELAQRETERAQREAERAQREAGRAQRLAAKLRELGLDPETI
jgi:hypothetical protein